MNSYIPLKGNPQRYVSDKTTIEELYFHTGNSGITSRVLETKKLPADRSYVEHVGYRLEFVHGANGHSSTMSTPLLSPKMVDHYIAMLERVKKQMEREEAYTAECDFQEHRIVQVMEGYKVDEVWSPEIITSPWASHSYLLGHTYSKEGHDASFVPYEGTRISKGGACPPGEPRYSANDIGRLVTDVADREKIAAPRRVFYVDVRDMAGPDAVKALEVIQLEIRERRSPFDKR